MKQMYLLSFFCTPQIQHFLLNNNKIDFSADNVTISNDDYNNVGTGNDEDQQQKRQRSSNTDEQGELDGHHDAVPKGVESNIDIYTAQAVEVPLGNTRKYETTKPTSAPDFGEDFVPGAGPVQYAPQSLDHFKRGYEERSVQRDKERYTLRNNSDRYGRGGRGSYNSSGGGGRGRGSNYNDRGGQQHYSHGGDREGTRFSSTNNSDDPWNQSYRDRPTILQGLDINALVDRLTTKLNNKPALFAELDRTRQDNQNVFDSGKALTALISIAARRKNIGLGHAAWDWMDHAGIAKNTFHYNSMISVTEKARDYQHALALLQEMKERNIKKNEVT
jgi:pentatricopeptide repeat protein